MENGILRNDITADFIINATSYSEFPSNALMKSTYSSKMNVGFVERKFALKKIMSIFAVSVTILLLTACNSTSGAAQKKMTAADLLDKSEQAMASSLKSVRAHISYDDYGVTIYDGDVENNEKSGSKFDMNMDAFLDPVKIRRQVQIHPRGVEKWNLEMYNVGDKLFVMDNRDKEWNETSTDPLAESFGTLISATNPLLDLSKFKVFSDDFILEPIEYGYALRLSLDRDEFKKFNEIFPEIGPSEEGFLLIDKMDFVITINKNTLYVTSFKMSADMKTYSGGNSYRARQKLNATYSYFNDIKDFVLPEEVKASATE